MPHLIDRRAALKLSAFNVSSLLVSRARADEKTGGWVEGQPVAAKVGMRVLADGGNAVDAIVAAALAVGVVAPHQTGVGGYGGSAIFATDGGKKITAIDFNSTAPAAAKADMFKGAKDPAMLTGWLSAGVPGVLAGLQKALDLHGTKPFAELATPAIGLARDGFKVDASFANIFKNAPAWLKKDAASAKLYIPNGELLKPGDMMRNPELATMLEELAKARSVEPFYRGDIAKRIAAAFKQNGGIVTAEDFAAYRAVEVEPLSLGLSGRTLHTPPPTAGGGTVLQALAILKQLSWYEWKADFATRRACVEALRLAWDDRLKLLGDAGQGEGPMAKLLSEASIRVQAQKVAEALRNGKPVAAATDGRNADGTIHLSAADSRGNWAALTLTHGSYFGAQVTVPGLGLTLGHGMSRFDPNPQHPNAPGPGKRPLHNMCPTIVLRDGKPILALGGRGGRKIPNAVFEVLAQFVGRSSPAPAALAAPRLHTEGGLKLDLEPKWPEEDVERFKDVGYTVARSASAYVSAVWSEKDGAIKGASR